MKILLLALFTTFAATASAQGLDPEMKKKFEEYLQKGNKDVVLKENGSIVVPYAAKRGETKNLPGVYTLPQDGMRYLVPNTKDIAPIPNVMTRLPDVALGKIPNAAAPDGLELLKGKINNLSVTPPAR